MIEMRGKKKNFFITAASCNNEKKERLPLTIEAPYPFIPPTQLFEAIL